MSDEKPILTPDEQICALIKDYLKENLTIEVDRDYSERLVRIKLILDEEEISSGYFHLNFGS